MPETSFQCSMTKEFYNDPTNFIFYAVKKEEGFSIQAVPIKELMKLRSYSFICCPITRKMICIPISYETYLDCTNEGERGEPNDQGVKLLNQRLAEGKVHRFRIVVDGLFLKSGRCFKSIKGLINHGDLSLRDYVTRLYPNETSEDHINADALALILDALESAGCLNQRNVASVISNMEVVVQLSVIIQREQAAGGFCQKRFNQIIADIEKSGQHTFFTRIIGGQPLLFYSETADRMNGKPVASSLGSCELS